MKITIYELLGLIKDGKAPKKIKIGNSILNLSKRNIIQYNFELYGQLSWEYYIENYRLDEKVVEILDKDFKLEPKKIEIEKVDLFKLDESMSKASLVAWQKANNEILKNKIDELIDEINNLKEKQ